MTRKHFEAIARVVRVNGEFHTNEHAKDLHKDIAQGLASVFANFNPNFDRARFLAACGIEKEAS